MKANYKNYEDWRTVMTDMAGITLSADYCKERIEALNNDKVPSTKAFVAAYGADHRNQIVKWFEQALAAS